MAFTETSSEWRNYRSIRKSGELYAVTEDGNEVILVTSSNHRIIYDHFQNRLGEDVSGSIYPVIDELDRDMDMGYDGRSIRGKMYYFRYVEPVPGHSDVLHFRDRYGVPVYILTGNNKESVGKVIADRTMKDFDTNRDRYSREAGDYELGTLDYNRTLEDILTRLDRIPYYELSNGPTGFIYRGVTDTGCTLSPLSHTLIYGRKLN